jgi:hypothetical protein
MVEWRQYGAPPTGDESRTKQPGGIKMSQLSGGERRQQPSLFGPIVLIAIGLYFLLSNLNLISGLHWWDVLRLWPLLLIFLGLNILAQQAPRPYGTLLSALVALVAVGVLGIVLVVGLDRAGPGWFDRIGQSEWQTQPIAFTADDVQTAAIDIQVGPPGVDVEALTDSRNLIEGTVTYADDLLFDTQVAGGRATVDIAPRGAGNWFFVPRRWPNFDGAERWQLGLSPRVPMALSLSSDAGSSRLDLRDLTLSELTAAANAGVVALLLPGGDYDATLAVNAAAAEITLPEDGRHTIELSVNAGSATLTLPAAMAARVEVNQSLSTFSAENSGLRRLSGDGDKEVWVTAGYAAADDRIDLLVDISVGSVAIQNP